MELNYLVDNLKTLLVRYTSENGQIEENLYELFTNFEIKNLNNEIDNYADFVLLAASLFELKAKRMLPQDDDVDWIEVFNYSSDSVFLADYFLSDNPDNLDKWQFPNTYLGSQELITICASGREYVKFPNHWEALVLADQIWKYWKNIKHILSLFLF